MLTVLVIFWTLGPVHLRPQTGHAQLERFAAYLALAVAWSVGYPRRRAWVAVGLVAMAVGLELGQLLVPGRDGRVADAAAKVLGALVGVGLTTLAETRLRLAQRP